MSKEYQVEKAIMPGSFMEEEFLQMIDFEGVSNYVLGYVDNPYEVYRTPLYALRGTYGVRLFCPIDPWAPVIPSKITTTLAMKAAPKIRFSFTFYTEYCTDMGYILLILVGPNIVGMDSFTATIKINGDDDKIYVKDVDGNWQEVGTIANFRDNYWYTLSATVDIIKQEYTEIEIGWIKFKNINVKYETAIPQWYFPGVTIELWPKATKYAILGVDNIIAKGID